MSTYNNISKSTVNIDGENIDIISNELKSEDLNIIVTKSQDTEFIITNTPHTYRIQIINYREEELTNVIFSDDIPFGLTYITGTLTIDGVNVEPTISSNTISYTIPTIAPSHTIEIVFKVIPQ